MSRLSPDQFRARFPIFNRRIYVNSCSQGALSTDVEAAMQEWIAQLARGRLAVGALGREGRRAAERLRRLHRRRRRRNRRHAERLRRHQRASRARSISPGRAGRSCWASSSSRRWRRSGWRSSAAARRSRGRAPHGDVLPMSAYEAVVDERTLIVPATHVCFRNGHKTDIAALTRLCHDRGAFVFLDDYQRTGSGPIDVRELGVDFMVTGCLKYLLASAGIGFLYVRRELIEQLEPTITGWFGRMNPFAFRIDAIDWPARCDRFESGTPPIPSTYAALGGLRLLDRIGYDVHWPARRASGEPATARRPRTPDSSCARRRPLPRADRSSSCRVSTRRSWSSASPHTASSHPPAATDCACRFTPTTTSPTWMR